MGNMKDEWFEEFYGEFPPYATPRWHTDDPIGNDKGSSTIAFRPWSEANISDLVEGWVLSDDYTDIESKDVKRDTMVFDIYDIQDELLDLLLKKHDDYGPKNISESPGGPLNGINVRMYDKLARLENLLNNKKEPKNESLRDTFLDLANYAIIGLLVLDKKWDKG